MPRAQRRAPAKPKAPATLFDADAARTEYTPVRVKYRSEVYELGKSAISLVAAPDLFAAKDDSEGAHVSMRRLLERLPECLTVLCPELGEAVSKHGLSAPEEMLLLKAVTEVLNRVGTFRPA